MRQVRRGARFAEESLAHVGASSEVGWERLDGDRAIELEIPGEIDDPHAASADLTLDIVLASQRRRERGQLRHDGNWEQGTVDLGRTGLRCPVGRCVSRATGARAAD
jgi:hypothetical protein